MRIFTGPWEAKAGGIKRVRIADSVLDQLLHGNTEVLWELQGLQDQGIEVVASPTGRLGDVESLRDSIKTHLELRGRSTAGDCRGKAGLALWSVGGQLGQRVTLAESAEADLYEPDIKYRPQGGLTHAQAASNLQAIGLGP